MTKSYLVFISNATRTCGVEEFTSQLAGRFRGRARSYVLGTHPARLLAALKDVDSVIFNFPMVGWKRKLASPFLAALAARCLGREVVVILHEWLALDWKRRVVLMPVLALASRICFSAPEIAAEFKKAPLAGFATSKRSVIPIPPNLLPPAELRPTPHSEIVREQRRSGRIILGQFGSIYPKKQSTAVLRVAQHLIEQGHDVYLVFVGSFIKGMDNVEEQFFEVARRHGVMERLLVTGYIADDRELFAIFEHIDVFCYIFPEGLTSRRASVLAAALFGRPVVVNSPASRDALAHHDLYLKLIGTQAIRLVPTDADIPAMAEAVSKALGSPSERPDFQDEIESVWRTVVERIDHAQ